MSNLLKIVYISVWSENVYIYLIYLLSSNPTGWLSAAVCFVCQCLWVFHQTLLLISIAAATAAAALHKK